MMASNGTDEIKKKLNDILTLNKQNIQLSKSVNLGLSMDLFRKILNYNGIKNEGVLYTIVRLFANLPLDNILTDVDDIISLNGDKISGIHLAYKDNFFETFNLNILFNNDLIKFEFSRSKFRFYYRSDITLYKDGLIDQTHDYIHIDSPGFCSDMIFDKNGIEIREESSKVHYVSYMPGVKINVTQTKSRDENGNCFNLDSKVFVNDLCKYHENENHEYLNMQFDERIIFSDLEEKVLGDNRNDCLCNYIEYDEFASYFPSLVNSIPILKIEHSNTRVKTLRP